MKLFLNFYNSHIETIRVLFIWGIRLQKFKIVGFYIPIILISFLFCTTIDAKSINISFGSCLKQKKDMGILKSIHQFSPDFFIFLGDNIYKDTYDIQDKRREYENLGANQDFISLRKKSKIFATWDDHDYGVNDSGEEYPLKRESQEEFLKFFYPDQFVERNKQEGIYSSEIIQFNRLMVHVILLDTRYFRSPLRKKFHFFGTYVPVFEPDATILGNEQWTWLERELKKKSDIKIIGTSIQFLNEDHGFEKWGNFPLEKEKLLKLLEGSLAEHIFFLSGDRHISETFSSAQKNYKYIYDITSSPLNNELPVRMIFPENPNRIGEILYDSSFGNIEITESKDFYILSFQYIKKNLEKISIPIPPISIPKSGRE